MEFKEAITAVMEYIETTPLLIKGKSVKICVPGKKKNNAGRMLWGPSHHDRVAVPIS